MSMPLDQAPVTLEGSVKWFNGDKGYGFANAPGVEKDIFIHVKQLHASGINDAMADGEKIKFVCNTGPKGLFATNIVRVNGVSHAETTVAK